MVSPNEESPGARPGCADGRQATRVQQAERAEDVIEPRPVAGGGYHGVWSRAGAVGVADLITVEGGDPDGC